MAGLTLIITGASVAADRPQGETTSRSHVLATSSIYIAADTCVESQRAISFYRQAYGRSRARMEASPPVPRVWYHDCSAVRRRAVEWQNRAADARVEADRWVDTNYAWWKWLPDKWQRVGACETGYGRRPGNWSHDSGTYVSAFGIYRAGYADDAHRIGNLSWDETRRDLGRLPTPREQYDAALSHYRAHGGFSGWGCRGA